MKPYVTIAREARAELVIKRSRFIGSCMRTESEDAARGALAKIQKEFWDASHNCFAYVVGEGCEIARSSDAGEPCGTAGQPILDAIRGKGLTNALVVVTRYFGGTLLGRGGLVQAYSKTASHALEQAGAEAFVPAVAVKLTVQYSMLARVDAFLQSVKHQSDGVDYAENVRIGLLLPMSEREAFTAALTELTDGRLSPEFGEERYCAFEG